MLREKVLFVDDEEAILNGFRRAFHKEFEVCVAGGGEAGLTAMKDKGPFAVIVSDMRMPGMNGAVFLSRARSLQPRSTRILLTGHSDAEATAEEIQQGLAFRFLSKPCGKEDLLAALNLGVEMYRDGIATRDLHETTREDMI